MKTRASGSRRVAQRPRPRIVSGELLRGRSQEIANAVARRAYDIYTVRGRADGHDEDDWRQAESELVFPLVVTVTDAGPLLTIEAPVPGFAADEIELCIEPRRVTITGQRAAGDAPGMQGLTTWMFRAVDLPEDVDTCDATASVEDFILEVTLRKAAPGDEK